MFVLVVCAACCHANCADFLPLLVFLVFSASALFAIFTRRTCVQKIDVMDYDVFGRNELIGRTVIDLEDRWFDTRWQVR